MPAHSHWPTTIAVPTPCHRRKLPPLARAVYHTSQVRQQIPAALYQAVAVVLRHVLALKAFRQGQRRSEPRLPHDLDVPAHLSGDGPT